MILVTLGTQDKPFYRLLKAIDDEILKGNIKDKVVVQAGFMYGKYQSNNMEMFDLIDRDEFNKLVSECDYLITHGGVGSILTGLKAGKKVIVCPRLAKYKEHMNDHQVQIVERFKESGYILAFNDGDDLNEVIQKIPDFKPQKYISNTENMIKLITDFIEHN